MLDLNIINIDRCQKGRTMKMRAAILDDDETMREMLSSFLKERGYEVIICPEPGICTMYTINDCNCSFGYSCTDVIITDLEMPKMTGLEYLDHQRKHGCKVSHIAVMSGGWTEKDFEYAQKKGYKLLIKPFKLQELAEWLIECENRTALHRELLKIHNILKENKNCKSP